MILTIHSEYRNDFMKDQDFEIKIYYAGNHPN